jgi:hypothetical protein
MKVNKKIYTFAKMIAIGYHIGKVFATDFINLFNKN